MIIHLSDILSTKTESMEDLVEKNEVLKAIKENGDYLDRLKKINPKIYSILEVMRITAFVKRIEDRLEKK